MDLAMATHLNAALERVERAMERRGDMIPRMSPFRHFCKPCADCDGGDPTCPACRGDSMPCDCRAAYEDAGDRLYHEVREREEPEPEEEDAC